MDVTMRTVEEMDVPTPYSQQVPSKSWAGISNDGNGTITFHHPWGCLAVSTNGNRKCSYYSDYESISGCREIAAGCLLGNKMGITLVVASSIVTVMLLILSCVSCVFCIKKIKKYTSRKYSKVASDDESDSRKPLPRTGTMLTWSTRIDYDVLSKEGCIPNTCPSPQSRPLSICTDDLSHAYSEIAGGGRRRNMGFGIFSRDRSFSIDSFAISHREISYPNFSDLESLTNVPSEMEVSLYGTQDCVYRLIPNDDECMSMDAASI